MNKKAKKIFIYFLFLLAVPIVLACVFFAVLYFAPGSIILGYKYVNFEEVVVQSFKQSDLSVKLVNSIRLIGNKAKIVVVPNTESEDVVVVYQQKVSGFTRENSIDANINFDYSVVYYEDHTEEYPSGCKGLLCTVIEPTGLFVSSGSTVYLKLPESYNLPILYCSSSQDISYTAKTIKKVEDVETTYKTNIGGVYFATQGSAKITFNCDSGSKLNFKTENGNVEFASNTFSGEKIKFDTKTGQFKFATSGNTSLTLTDKLEILSYDDKGAKLNLDVLDGNLTVNSTSGEYKINTIGSSEAQKSVILNSTNSKFEFGTVNGFVSLQNNGDERANSFKAITINNTTSQSNSFEVGKGYVNIEELIGNSRLISSSGKLYIAKIEKNSSVYAFSDTGTIDLTYESSNVPIKETAVNVFSKTGNVNLYNISGLLDVEILSSSKDSTLNIVFTAICNDNSGIKDNIIDAKDRDVEVTLKGFSDYFKFRFLTTVEPTFSDIFKDSQYPPTRITSGSEYLLGQEVYKGYSYQYRCNYGDGVSQTVYNTYAKLLISTTNSIKMFSKPI